MRVLPTFVVVCQDELTKVDGLVRATRYVVSRAADEDVREANRLRVGPIVHAINVCGSTATRNGCKHIRKLMRFIEACIARGVNPAYGARTSGCKWNYPIIAAAYFGLADVVSMLLDAGSLPGLANADGETALHAALQNPTAASGNFLRACDVETASVLVRRGVVVSALSAWRPDGQVIFIGSERFTPLYNAVHHKNKEAAAFLRRHGACLSDRDFLQLRRDRKARKHIWRLRPIVAHVENREGHACNTSNRFASVAAFEPSLAWSFPPTWHQTFALVRYFGLPRTIIESHVAPCCSRGWFFPSDAPDMSLYPPVCEAPQRDEVSKSLI